MEAFLFGLFLLRDGIRILPTESVIGRHTEARTGRNRLDIRARTEVDYCGWTGAGEWRNEERQ